jgi:FkbM family methyltransferase
MAANKTKIIKAGTGYFSVRENTSDLKAIKEVVVNEAYKRRGFVPEPDEVWIDIGANCGAFSVWAAKKGCRVIAFEPDPENAAIAQSNIDLNNVSKSVKLYTLGLTAEDEPKRLYFYRNTANGNVWRNSLYKEWRGGERIAVDTVPVEAYWNPDYCIKLDAEGVEMPILEKYGHIKVKKLVFEWSFDIDPSIKRFNDVIDKLKNIYDNVQYGGFQAGYETWQPSWFPAARMVWCY